MSISIALLKQVETQKALSSINQANTTESSEDGHEMCPAVFMAQQSRTERPEQSGNILGAVIQKSKISYLWSGHNLNSEAKGKYTKS